MNREEIIKDIIKRGSMHPNEAREVVDFILENAVTDAHNKTLAELERVKEVNQELRNQIAVFKKAAKRLETQPSQAEKELGKLRDFVQEFYNLKNPSNRQWFQITEKAYQLLTPKE